MSLSSSAGADLPGRLIERTINTTKTILDVLNMDQPLWKDDLNPRFIASNAIPLRLESRIFKDQYASDRNSHTAQWRLSECFFFSAVEGNIRPRSRIDLDVHVKRDHGPGGFVAVDDVSHTFAKIPMTIFERVRPCG